MNNVRDDLFIVSIINCELSHPFSGDTMEFNTKSGNIAKQRSACIVVGVHEGRRLTPPAQQLDKLSKGYLTANLKRGDFRGKAGQTLLLHNVPGTVCERILLVGCGREKELNDSAYQKIINRSTITLNNAGVKEAISCLAELNVKGRDLHWKIRQSIELVCDALYRFDQLKSKKNDHPVVFKKLTCNVTEPKDVATGKNAIKEGQAIVKGVELVKNLGNLPPNICTPSYLASEAESLEKKYKAIKVQVIEKAAMEKLGMGALLSVARGSREPAKLIIVNYQGGKKTDKPVALVGKGITFDTGGISIKPAQNMDEMKYDMCGAASVLGTLTTVAELQLPINIIGVIPSTENMPGGNASRPGDIVTSMSGQTIEILNTDAEGRLILCDALTYTERFKPDVIIDIATLTGACVVALGKHASGLLSNHEPLAHALLDAGKQSGDRAWELPLWDDYQDQLKSNFADMSNVGGREGGTITAACFLSRFTKNFHWAHLDIAGTAWKTGSHKGATGRPVPLLTQYLINRSK